MADNSRGVHVSPGVYSREVELTYAVKSLGITTLGVAGETLRGPAFQPIHIENWREFVDVFGGTSTEKYKGNQYPKYELPYIAKSYLSESKQLEVVRVLGLSGYKAGPAWVITAQKGDDNTHKYAVAVIRSRGHYEYYFKHTAKNTEDECACPSTEYDKLIYEVGEKVRMSGTCKVTTYNDILDIKPYVPIQGEDSCEGSTIKKDESATIIKVSSTNNGRFTLFGNTGFHPSNATINTGDSTYFEYSVSLNPFDKDFILKVLGTDPQNGEAPIYVESLYEEALHWMIEKGDVDRISYELTFYNAYDTSDFSGLKAVDGILNKPHLALGRKDLGRRYLITQDSLNVSENGLYITKFGLNGYPKDVDEEDVPESSAATNNDVGRIVTVRSHADRNGKRHYVYSYYDETEAKASSESGDILNLIDKLEYYDPNNDNTNHHQGNILQATKLTIVKNNADGLFYRLDKSGTTKVCVVVTCDLNNYSDAYRFASTPWFVSNLKGDGNHIEVNKLFRFHTISDGNSSNYEVKVSIENILPDTGEFDVIIRHINDTDDMVIPLEKYGKVNLIPGDKNYIAYRIGSFDGTYETKSKYVTVEVNESISTQTSVPAGFMGYPKPNYEGKGVVPEASKGVYSPYVKYNVDYNKNLKNRKQYFGLSNISGVDVDLFTYKGISAYINDGQHETKGFHLDSRVGLANYTSKSDMPTLTIDGVVYDSDYFETVSITNGRTDLLTGMPIIGSEEEMYGCIYEYKNLRKFTAYFYGGFDGWDVYRNQRTNTDDFKLTNYRGMYDKNSGEGRSFNRIWSPELLQLNQEGITSDWYAYLSAYRQFANPEAVDVNVFATPGIDYVNNTLLIEEVIDMIETERADSIYVVTTPDKPAGAGDYVDEMYTPEDAVYNLEYTELNSNYACTYYPWVKYLDQDNNQYIYLPATKDAVRNFAMTDNVAFPWFAPAGINRGDVNCVRAHYVTKIDDEDILYNGRINPVKTFAQDGVKLWGQKNLQDSESQLNRIAVRRLLLRMRKLIAIACRPIIFEQNDPVTKNDFLTAITPIMDNIRTNRGISDYRIEVNDTIESRERRELPAKIYFKPYNALEYITLDFILTPEGVSFSDI